MIHDQDESETPDDRSKERTSYDLAQWIMTRTDGDPAAALVAMAEISAELIRLNSAPARCRANYIEGIDRFLATSGNMFLIAREGDW